MNNSRKFAGRHLTQSRARMASDLPSDWYSAENQRHDVLEFFNRITLKPALSLSCSDLMRDDPLPPPKLGHNSTCLCVYTYLRYFGIN